MELPPRTVTVVLPTYNEAQNVAAMIGRLRSALGDAEIIVVDDDSPDLTWKVAQEAGARVIRRVGERGLASALKRGVEESGGEVVVWMDADQSMPPEDVPRLLDAIDAGADVAVGSRYATGGRDARPLLRVITSRLINLFANLLLPVKVSDYDSGFVAARRDVFGAAPIPSAGHGEYCIEFLCAAGLKGFEIREVGYEFT
ncbi:MAG: glycosyltransferase, partial [bacterium]